MKIITAIQISIKLFTIGYGAGAVRTTGRFAAPAAAGKRADTCGFYPLNSRFPLFPNPAQTRDRRPLRKWGTTEDFFFRRGAQSAPISLPIRSVRFHTATHTISSPQARHKVNCPKGKRNHRVHFPFSIPNFPFYTHKKEESSRFPLARYSLLYPLGVTIASSGVPAAQSGQALPRTKFW